MSDASRLQLPISARTHPHNIRQQSIHQHLPHCCIGFIGLFGQISSQLRYLLPVLLQHLLRSAVAFYLQRERDLGKIEIGFLQITPDIHVHHFSLEEALRKRCLGRDRRDLSMREWTRGNVDSVDAIERANVVLHDSNGLFCAESISLLHAERLHECSGLLDLLVDQIAVPIEDSCVGLLVLHVGETLVMQRSEEREIGLEFEVLHDALREVVAAGLGEFVHLFVQLRAADLESRKGAVRQLGQLGLQEVGVLRLRETERFQLRVRGGQSKHRLQHRGREVFSATDAAEGRGVLDVQEVEAQRRKRQAVYATLTVENLEVSYLVWSGAMGSTLIAFTAMCVYRAPMLNKTEAFSKITSLAVNLLRL